MIIIINIYGINYIGFDEVWKYISYEDVEKNKYEVSNLGRIRNKNRILKGNNPKNEHGGYHRISLKNINGKIKKYPLHRIVYNAFGDKKLTKKYEINHINGNKDDNRIFNLEMCTRKENAKHASINNLYKNCEEHYSSTLTNKEVEQICEYASKGMNIVSIINTMGLNNRGHIVSNISKILTGKTWKRISKKYNIDYNLYHYKTYSYNDINEICKMIFVYDMKNNEIVKKFPQYENKN